MKAFVSVLVVAICIEFGSAVLMKHEATGKCVKDKDPSKAQTYYSMGECDKTATQFTFKRGRSDMKGSQKISSASTGKEVKSKCVYGNAGDEDNNNRGICFSGDCDGKYPSCPYKMWVLKDSKASPGKFLVSHPMDDPNWCWTNLEGELRLVECNENDNTQLWSKV